MGLKNYLMSRKDGNNDRYKMFIGQNIIKQLKDAGAVLALLSNKADGSGPLTGNDSPWVDLSGFGNDCTLFNQAGTVSSGWQSNPFVNRMDGTDDYGGFADTASLDITSAPLAIGVTFKNPTDDGGFTCAKSISAAGDTQYGLLNRVGRTIEFYVTGVPYAAFAVDSANYVNVIFYWDGVNVTSYENGVQKNQTTLGGTLTSYGTLKLCKRGTSHLAADICTQTIYTGSDINKILAAEAKISAEYLALNP